MLVKFNKPRVLGILDGRIRLIPGLNDVRDALWAEAKLDSSIKAKMEDGELEEIGVPSVQGGSPNSDDAVGTLLSMKPKQAESMAKDTVDAELLNKWLEEEKRPRVAAAIKAQLAELSNIQRRSDEPKSQE